MFKLVKVQHVLLFGGMIIGLKLLSWAGLDWDKPSTKIGEREPIIGKDYVEPEGRWGLVPIVPSDEGKPSFYDRPVPKELIHPIAPEPKGIWM